LPARFRPTNNLPFAAGRPHPEPKRRPNTVTTGPLRSRERGGTCDRPIVHTVAGPFLPAHCHRRPGALLSQISGIAHACLSGGPHAAAHCGEDLDVKVIAGLAAIGVTLLLIVAIGVIGRGNSGSESSNRVEIVLADLRFSPNQLSAKVGVPLTVRLVNRGLERHDLNFPSLHMPGLEGVESILAPGETRTVTLQFDQPGEHTFICTLPGHAAAGMTGAVIVRP